jgi:hypothetical protein
MDSGLDLTLHAGELAIRVAPPQAPDRKSERRGSSRKKLIVTGVYRLGSEITAVSAPATEDIAQVLTA